MKIRISRIGRVSWIFAIAIGYGAAQQTAPEKHVKDIEKEHSRQVIIASPLCQRVRANPGAPNQHEYPVDRSTLALDLKSLMEQSEDVILTTSPTRGVTAIAPSGDDVLDFNDVRVLRTWKGSYKPGDTVTFSIPFTHASCSLEPGGETPSFTTLVGLGELTREQDRFGRDEERILFLRHAQGSEKQLAPGLRMTGGSGWQGMYSVQFPWPSPLIEESHCENDISHNKFPSDAKLCMEFLDTSDMPIFVPLKIDPLFKKYNGMQVSEFLDEVQKTAESLEYTLPNDTAK